MIATQLPKTKINKETSVLIMFICLVVIFTINVRWGSMELMGPLSIKNILYIIGCTVSFLTVSKFKISWLRYDILLVFLLCLYIYLNRRIKLNIPLYEIGPFFYFLFYINIVNFLNSTKNIRPLLKIVLVSVLIMVGVAYLEIFTGSTFYASDWQKGERYNEIGIIAFGSTVASKNFFSFNLIPCIIITIYLRATSNKKIAYNIIIANLIFIELLAFSRAGWALLVLSLALIHFNKYLSSRLIKYLFRALLLFIILTFASYKGENFFMSMFPSYADDNSFIYRSVILVLLFNSFISNPFLGIGSGNFKEISGKLLEESNYSFNDIATSPMNTYFGTLAELGIIGTMLFFLFVKEGINSVRENLHTQYRKEFIYLFIAFYSILLNAFFIDAFFAPMMLIVYALLSHMKELSKGRKKLTNISMNQR